MDQPVNIHREGILSENILRDASFSSGAAVPVPRLTPAETVNRIMNNLRKIRDEVLPSIPAAEKQKLAWKVHLREPNPEEVMVSPERFVEESKPLVLDGRQDLGRYCFIGGLTATGRCWTPLATELHRLTSIYSEIHPLKGQNGIWRDFRSTTHNMWVDNILQICGAGKEPPVLFAFSTSAAAALSAWREKPGFCRAMVLVGAPIFLKSKTNEMLMDKVLAYTSPLNWVHSQSILQRISTSFPRTEDSTDTSPQFIRIPVSTSLQLRIAQLSAIEAAARCIFPPIFYAQGMNDAPVSKSTWSFFKTRTIVSPLKVVPRRYPNADHTVQEGPAMTSLFKDVSSFLRTLYAIEGYSPAVLPNFLAQVAA